MCLRQWEMESFKRAADGRRYFSSEFRKQIVLRVGRKEQSVAELSREIGVVPSVIHRWVKLAEGGSDAAVGANEEVVPASDLRLAQQRIKELERALGRKTMEVEILQAARDEIKKSPTSTACQRNDRFQGGADLPSAGNWASQCVQRVASAQ